MIEKLEENFINADANKVIVKVNEIVDILNKPAPEVVKKEPATKPRAKAKAVSKK